MDMGHDWQDCEGILAGLTDKQRDVLDLLIEHKTSKEIARELGISPHTVDQRIQFAKDKLGASSRSEAAVAYRKLVETYEQMTYEDSGIVESAIPGNDSAGTQGPFPKSWLRVPASWHRERTPLGTDETAIADYQVVPELFDGRYGTLVRLATIFAIAVLLVLLVLGGLAMFSQLSQIMRG